MGRVFQAVLVVQWLGRRLYTAKVAGSIPARNTLLVLALLFGPECVYVILLFLIQFHRQSGQPDGLDALRAPCSPLDSTVSRDERGELELTHTSSSFHTQAQIGQKVP